MIMAAFKFKSQTYNYDIVEELAKGSEYERQAIEFLKDTKTDLTIVYSHFGKHFAGDKVKRDIYVVTLENERGEYSFMFGDSINNTEKNEERSARGKRRETPKAYDILACLSVYEIEDFADFVSMFGYSLDTEDEIRNAQKTYRAVKEESRELRRLFDSEQLEALNEIA